MEYEKHTTYCGGKTKKCMMCNRNVCNKDEDMHNFGGECNAFREEDKRKREAEELAKKAQIEKDKKNLKERENVFQANFGIVDDDDEDWAVSEPSQGS